eukprot:TRINITY_DN2594_c0_g1_i2.p1 TRINITY_DN2594_c0_g1~~TRINITY_DN2594_c0_g1_i2.p1  ORF type:complete len:662 (+),score=231.45 TRINITY_DN2594_c0_g1_i2:1340-3325(+)
MEMTLEDMINVTWQEFVQKAHAHATGTGAEDPAIPPERLNEEQAHTMLEKYLQIRHLKDRLGRLRVSLDELREIRGGKKGGPLAPDERTARSMTAAQKNIIRLHQQIVEAQDTLRDMPIVETHTPTYTSIGKGTVHPLDHLPVENVGTRPAGVPSAMKERLAAELKRTLPRVDAFGDQLSEYGAPLWDSYKAEHARTKKAPAKGSQGAGSAPSKSWPCKVCTYENRPGTIRCAMCDSSPEGTPTTPATTDDWALTGQAGKKQRKQQKMLEERAQKEKEEEDRRRAAEIEERRRVERERKEREERERELRRSKEEEARRKAAGSVQRPLGSSGLTKPTPPTAKTPSTAPVWTNYQSAPSSSLGGSKDGLGLDSMPSLLLPHQQQSQPVPPVQLTQPSQLQTAQDTVTIGLWNKKASSGSVSAPSSTSTSPASSAPTVPAPASTQGKFAGPYSLGPFAGYPPSSTNGSTPLYNRTPVASYDYNAMLASLWQASPFMNTGYAASQAPTASSVPASDQTGASSSEAYPDWSAAFRSSSSASAPYDYSQTSGAGIFGGSSMSPFFQMYQQAASPTPAATMPAAADLATQENFEKERAKVRDTVSAKYRGTSGPRRACCYCGDESSLECVLCAKTENNTYFCSPEHQHLMWKEHMRAHHLASLQPQK